MLVLNRLGFAYPSAPDQLFCFDLAVGRGQTIIMEGRSGIGKSTLLNLIAGFLTPTGGTMTWHGNDLITMPPASRPLSMIFQENNLFNHLDCARNIALGLRPSLTLSDTEWQAIDEVMDELSILSLASRKPEQISGGQQQRVALARALIRAKWQERHLLLFDEPFSALDPETRLETIEVVKQLISRHAMAAVMVSHNPEDAELLDAEVMQL